ncbi:MAG: hypothetical protein K2J39_12205, partial [Ruminococcus sp.]|nr:hypothetical protein [Ruminococcus sp.]
MQIREIFRQKSTRFVAFVSACIIMLVCLGCCIGRYIAISRTLDALNTQRANFNELSEARQELFSELWVFGTMYLRNLDEDGNLTGSSALKKSTKNTLRELGLMDKNNKIIIPSNENLRYYVTWGDNSISSDSSIFNDINIDTEYCDTYNNGSYSIGHGYYYYSYYDSFSWFDTDYGMAYYDFPHEIAGKQACAVYSYDTSDLDYSLDNLNVKIYDKPDGTPACFDYRELRHGAYVDSYAYYDYDEENSEILSIPSALTDNFNDSDYYLYFDAENQTWSKIKKSPVVKGDVSGLKIGIKPTDTFINELRRSIETEQAYRTDLINYVVKFIPFVIFSLILMIYFIATSGKTTKNQTAFLSFFDRLWAELILAIGFVAVFVAMVFVQEIYEAVSLTSDVFADNPTYPAILWSSVLTSAFAIVILSVNTIVKRIKLNCLYRTTFSRNIINLLIITGGKVVKKIQSVLKKLEDFRLIREMADTNIIAKRFIFRLILLF